MVYTNGVNMENLSMKKLYVGCSLTQANEAFKESIRGLKDTLRSDYTVLDFASAHIKDPTPKMVYDRDIRDCVVNCDIFLAICDLPSLGLGYEMATAIEKLDTPTLGVAHKDANVSRLILGIQQPCFSFTRYETLDQIPALLRSFAREKGL